MFAAQCLSCSNLEHILFAGGWVGGTGEAFKTFILNASHISLTGFTPNS